MKPMSLMFLLVSSFFFSNAYGAVNCSDYRKELEGQLPRAMDSKFSAMKVAVQNEISAAFKKEGLSVHPDQVSMEFKITSIIVEGEGDDSVLRYNIESSDAVVELNGKTYDFSLVPFPEVPPPNFDHAKAFIFRSTFSKDATANLNSLGDIVSYTCSAGFKSFLNGDIHRSPDRWFVVRNSNKYRIGREIMSMPSFYPQVTVPVK